MQDLNNPGGSDLNNNKNRIYETLQFTVTPIIMTSQLHNIQSVF